MNTPNDPVSNVIWVPIDQVVANDYNPNNVAKTEMKLLFISVLHDGYTQPIVTIHDKDQDKYIIVDGFHRHLICKTYKEISERTGGRVPIVVIDKPINDRMASTVRHNRARGKHSVDGMASMVFSMLDNGWEDAEICNQLGLEAEELVRLKHITGFSKLFENAEYKSAWETDRQLRLKKEFSSRPPRS
jgi:ParB-like chromosome segregation protein Spo0J